VSAEVQQLALAGQLIQAIKLQRAQTGQDLRAAKAAVESFASPPSR
jgi:ribosomal protein L7/L12